MLLAGQRYDTIGLAGKWVKIFKAAYFRDSCASFIRHPGGATGGIKGTQIRYRRQRPETIYHYRFDCFTMLTVRGALGN